MLMAIEVTMQRRVNGGLRMRAKMGVHFAYYEWDFEVCEDANARHAFRKFRRDLLAKGLMEDKLVWDAARLADGGYAFVARLYPAGEEV